MMQNPYIGAALLECAGRAKRRRRFGLTVDQKRCRATLATALQIISLFPVVSHNARRK